MEINRVGVVGAGTMGHGIAQVCALAGCEVVLCDLNADVVAAGLDKIRANLAKGVEKGKLAPEAAEQALSRVNTTTEVKVAGAGADLVIEAIPEKLALKQELFRSLGAPPQAILATNTSSLSVKKIASAAPDPSRVMGMHFFNPVHIMELLELVVHEGTAPEVRDAIVAFGKRIGKETILVQDVPGFATSRLGVLLGMEAIRMVSEGVASPEDIDKAMVLGYRHPVGPLRLTDMVGLDVRLAIGEYLATSLANFAFEPPGLLRRMVAEGKLGKKSGQGFYKWD